MSRNPETCPHNIIEDEDGEYWCAECGLDLTESHADMIAAREEDEAIQDER